MTVIDTGIITAVILVGMVILYKALKEPLDLLFGFLGAILGNMRDKFVEMLDSRRDSVEVITYG